MSIEENFWKCFYLLQSPSSKKSDAKGDGKASKLLQDNYEEVAMDIDSDDGTTTVPEIEDIDIKREQVLVNVFVFCNILLMPLSNILVDGQI